MTKLVSLRVVVPADDDAPFGDIQQRLRQIIEAAGTQRLQNGTDDPDGASPRVHWIAVDVLQGSDRSTTLRPRGRRPSSSRPVSQSELPT